LKQQAMATPRFHTLTVANISPQGEAAVAVALTVPDGLRETFAFEPGQFITLRAHIDGHELRRSYSICSARSRLARQGDLEIGIRAVDGGLFSNWAARSLQAGDHIEAMPPEGRFTVKRPRAAHRVGFAAGAGITPILSIIASTMQEQPESKFTLVYGNRRMSSVMFNEELQDLKDQYTGRLTLIHILSRQAQEAPLLEGRIDAAKVHAVIEALLPPASMDEVFVCGPEGMIEATESTLLASGVPRGRIRTERFTSAGTPARRASGERSGDSALPVDGAVNLAGLGAGSNSTSLEVHLDGKAHSFSMGAQDRVLDIALRGGLDLPFSCKAGVCCTCRARVLEGQLRMERNFTLEDWEMKRGFVLTCQARPLSTRVVVSYDER
jgi:ring-1,2-phenylacetyl-CoA epoxidase subunit PaaE